MQLTIISTTAETNLDEYFNFGNTRRLNLWSCFFDIDLNWKIFAVNNERNGVRLG